MKRGVLNSLRIFLVLVLLQACTPNVTTDAPSAPPPKCGELEPLAEAPQETPLFLRGFMLLEETQDPAIGFLATDSGNLIGSAVLIHPNIAITAGHCLDGQQAKWFIAGGMLNEVESFVLHPMYKIGDVLVIDVGLILLKYPSTITPLQLVPKSYTYTKLQSICAIGYGGGVKKKSYPDTFSYFGTTIEEPWCFKMLPIFGSVWFGDSGGAIVDENGLLIGIISSLLIYRERLYENNVIRLPELIDWIEKTEEIICN